MDKVTRQVHAWAAEKVGIEVSEVKSVYFTHISGGYCETCEYDTFGIEVWTGKKYIEHEPFDNSATNLIKEILDTEVEVESDP